RDTHDEDRYEFEPGFIAVASRQPARPAFFLHLIACGRASAAFDLIRGTPRIISKTRSFAHANHRQRDDPVRGLTGWPGLRPDTSRTSARAADDLRGLLGDPSQWQRGVVRAVE